MKNFRIALIIKIGKFKVYKVDGNYIRAHLEPNFTNFGQYYRFPKLIPKYEFFIDQEGFPAELGFYLTHLITEFRAMESGMSYDKALDLADKYEEVERHKSKKYKNAPKSYPEQIKKIQKKKIYTFRGIDVYLIDDDLVRDLYRVEFTEGGHDKIYKFIPKNTVWISSSVNKKEIPFLIIHEIVEKFLMDKGMSYNKAHIIATKKEWESRNKK